MKMNNGGVMAKSDLIQRLQEASVDDGVSEPIQPDEYSALCKEAVQKIAEFDQENLECWVEIHKLRVAVKGPVGFETWKDAAISERVRAESLQSQLAAAQEDVERLDYLDHIANNGACPGLINDDAGHWAVSHCGIQNVPDSTPADISTTFFVMASEWKNSVREAIDADMSAAQTGEPHEQESVASQMALMATRGVGTAEVDSSILTGLESATSVKIPIAAFCDVTDRKLERRTKMKALDDITETQRRKGEAG